LPLESNAFYPPLYVIAQDSAGFIVSPKMEQSRLNRVHIRNWSKKGTCDRQMTADGMLLWVGQFTAVGSLSAGIILRKSNPTPAQARLNCMFAS